MHRRRIGNLGIRGDLGPIKFREYGRRRDAVEAVAVIQDAKFHIIRKLPKGKTF